MTLGEELIRAADSDPPVDRVHVSTRTGGGPDCADCQQDRHRAPTLIAEGYTPPGGVVSEETRTRWMVGIAAAVVVAVCVVVVALALMMHPGMTLEPLDL